MGINDTRMNGMNGRELCLSTRKRLSEVAVIAYMMFDGAGIIAGMRLAGARGFVLETFMEVGLLKALYAMYGGVEHHRAAL